MVVKEKGERERDEEEKRNNWWGNLLRAIERARGLIPIPKNRARWRYRDLRDVAFA